MSEKFRVGERVRLLHENLEGVILEVLSPKKLLVIIDEFDESEVNVDEVVRIHGEEQFFMGERESAVSSQGNETEIPRFKGQSRAELLLVICPVKVAGPDIAAEIWLVNPGNESRVYAVWLRIRKQFVALSAGFIQPVGRNLLGELSKDHFDHLRSAVVQVLPFGDKSGDLRSFYPEFKAAFTSAETETLPLLGKAGFVFELRESTFSEHFNPEKKAKEFQLSSKPMEEVDLHIEALDDDWELLSADEILSLQLDTFERQMNAAIAYNLSRIVFIHGVGSGRLKTEIRERLNNNPHVKAIRPGHYQQYGGGATEVLL